MKRVIGTIKDDLEKLSYEELLDLANAYASLFTPETWYKGKMEANGKNYIACGFNGTDCDWEFFEEDKGYKNAELILKFLGRD